MAKEYRQIEWDPQLEDDCRHLIRLAVREDLDRLYDWTTVALVPDGTPGTADVVARGPGVVAGLPAARMVLAEYDSALEWTPRVADGDRVQPGDVLAAIAGPARSLLTAERPLLNFIGHLSGIATLTRRYVDAVAGLPARIFDTRKTTPGWRRLEKYAVRCGGGWNHRLGLFDGVLIKDNHLALLAAAGAAHYTPAQAVRRCREVLASMSADGDTERILVAVEVDSLLQLDEVLPLEPDVVLLDNMSLVDLRAAVARRDAGYQGVQLEASGGVQLSNVADVARCGVERISVGALTHSAPWLDVALDWR